MDLSESLKNLASVVKVELILAVIGLSLVLFGIFSFFGQGGSNTDIEIIPASGSSELDGEVVVDVSGQVANPGIYRLTSQDRIADAIEAAGGFSVNADSEYISKNLNLASKLKDGMKVYVPKKGETGLTSKSSTSVSIAGSSTINLNSASQNELESLPGIGPVTASKIIAARPFSTVDELIKS